MGKPNKKSKWLFCQRKIIPAYLLKKSKYLNKLFKDSFFQFFSIVFS
jgi:hypothetical protein